MTQAEKLERLIQRAIDGGWEPEDWVQGPQHLVQSLFQLDKVNTVIFNHEFARALFGEFPVFIADEDIAKDTLGRVTMSGLVEWQHHLQSAVISPDPISYMYSF